VIVLEASAAVELLLGTAIGALVADRIRDRTETLHAPFLLDVEVAQVLRRYARDRAITAAEGRDALEMLQAIDVERYDHGPLLARVWELRHNVTAYDAVYVALAEALDATLLTTDARLAKATSRRRGRVEVVG
jgi:predicted nucleic acid-binding protein